MKYDFSMYEHARVLPDEETRAAAAKAMGLEKFGPELDGYLAKYGYLACGSVEMLGITGHQGLSSDMVRTTLDVVRIAPWTAGHVVLHKITDDRCAVVGPDDQVYLADPSSGGLVPVGTDLYGYLAETLGEAAPEE